jgi:enolase-phosphatase E1
MDFNGQAILLDIEGTTSSVSFVYDVMFPQVRRELSRFLEQNWQDADLQLACDHIARDAGHASVEGWCGPNSMDQRENIETEVIRLMDGDVKATGLKQLQGLVWRHGFQSGEMKAHVYPDVPECLQSWRQAGIDLRIYSSGSVQAQHLFFAHTEIGDLLSLFSGHYDTTIGSKKEPSSYDKIANDWDISASEILFVSDVVTELDAAKTAGLQTRLCLRPGNASVEDGHGHASIETFDQV